MCAPPPTTMSPAKFWAKVAKYVILGILALVLWRIGKDKEGSC